MNNKKYITGADVLRALADGKRLLERDRPHSPVVLADAASMSVSYLVHGNWEIVEKRATDAELIAEMERLADEMDQRGVVLSCDGKAGTYRDCARMLRERSVKP